MLHENLIRDNKEKFIELIKAYSSQLGIQPDWLMQVMYKESRLDPHVFNRAGSGAVGLIQFMPSTAERLGTSTGKLAKMSNVDQLYYVFKYLEPYRNKMKAFGDVYLAVFYPAAIGQPDDYLLPEYVTRQNAGLDTDHSGRISKAEIVKWASVGME